MKGYLPALLDLFYPPACVVCEEVLATGERYICTGCRYGFPHDPAEHARLAVKFDEACRVGVVYALFRYDRESRYRNLIHAVKYHGRKKLGIFLGEMLGERIQGKVEAGVIHPMPLHPRRERARGFNQSALIARGVATVLQLPVLENVVTRVVDNPSQTGLNADARSRNAENIFALNKPGLLDGKHVLLVDDVITTGATVTSCLKALGTVPGIRVSVACLAHAGAN
jgi:ComF family protein